VEHAASIKIFDIECVFRYSSYRSLVIKSEALCLMFTVMIIQAGETK
jgi:hypothetical protein